MYILPPIALMLCCGIHSSLTNYYKICCAIYPCTLFIQKHLSNYTCSRYSQPSLTVITYILKGDLSNDLRIRKQRLNSSMFFWNLLIVSLHWIADCLSFSKTQKFLQLLSVMRPSNDSPMSTISALIQLQQFKVWILSFHFCFT